MAGTDDELAEKLKSGDESAFELLYQRHSKSLLRHLTLLMGNTAEGEDMLHESLMLMIQKINFYEPRKDLRSSFMSWLFRLATNRAIDEIRKRKKHQAESEKLESSSYEKFEVKERNMAIADHLLKLPPLQRTVLSLRVHEDLSYLEIATICGKDVNSVKQSLFHARRALKSSLMNEGVTS